MSKKTNVDYLRELLKDNDEANEFLDAIIRDREITMNSQEADNEDKEFRINELLEQLEEFKTGEGLANIIQTGMEPIYWHTDNIRLIGLMETFEEKVKKCGDIKVQAALSAV
jgi:hypothetical protein